MCLMLLAGAYDAMARQGAVDPRVQQQAIGGTAMALYQSYDEDGLHASQVSFPLYRN